MRAKLILFGCALGLTLAASAQATYELCDVFCTSWTPPNARCYCSSDSTLHPNGLTSCGSWGTYC
jgi:hypothetical protein